MGRGWLWWEPSGGGIWDWDNGRSRPRPPPPSPDAPNDDAPGVQSEGGCGWENGGAHRGGRTGRGNGMLDEKVGRMKMKEAGCFQVQGSTLEEEEEACFDEINSRSGGGGRGQGGGEGGSACCGQGGQDCGEGMERGRSRSYHGQMDLETVDAGLEPGGIPILNPDMEKRGGGERVVGRSTCEMPDACRGRLAQGQRARAGGGGRDQGHYSGASHRGRFLGGGGHVLWFLVAAVLLQSCGGYITLSDKGYSFKHALLASAGVKVKGDVRVNGMIVSKPVANLQCNPSRRGAIRWNQRKFEACDGETGWRPLSFCSRDCDINTNGIPCGIPVRNKCDKLCQQTGTGLNMRQCMLAASTTPCNTPVKDMCGNACGLTGAMGCDRFPMDLGELIIGSMQGIESNTTFRLSVGKAVEGSPTGDERGENALFLTYHEDRGERIEGNDTIPMVERHDLAMIQRLKDGEVMGIEFAKPPGQQHATTRVSMHAELTGQYVRIGTDEETAPSHVFVDGTIDKKCPFLFNAGSNGGNFTQVCLEDVEGDSDIVFPEVSGVVITSGNRQDLRSIPGLHGEDPFLFTGTVKNTSRIDQPLPRVGMCDYGENTDQCQSCQAWFSPLADEYDMYRLYYTVNRWQNPRLVVSDYVLEGLRAMQAEGASRDDLASALEVLRYQEVMINENARRLEEAFIAAVDFDYASKLARVLNASNTTSYTSLNGYYEVYPWNDDLGQVDTDNPINVTRNESIRWDESSEFWPDLYNVTNQTGNAKTNRTLVRFLSRNVSEVEKCFVCCCPDPTLLPPSQDPWCLSERHKTKFCSGGPDDGEVCNSEDDCSEYLDHWGYTVYPKCLVYRESSPEGQVDDDPLLHPYMTCYEADHGETSNGYTCFDLREERNYTTRIGFRNPTKYQRISFPDASGSVVTTGSLESITSIGVQAAPIFGTSSIGGSVSHTALVFTPEGDGSGPSQRRPRPSNNTLVVPSSRDGILLSTGSLFDITEESGHMTGLQVETDAHISGWLRVGADPMTSGIRAPPGDASTTYTHPHGGQGSPQGRPAQLAFHVDDASTVLEFEPSPSGESTHITVPAASGTIVTTGNLEAVTAQSGFMSSVKVLHDSFLQGGMTVGSLASGRDLTIQGVFGETMVYTEEYEGDAPRSKTAIKFENQAGSSSEVQFPASSGRVITTATLPDVHRLTADVMTASDSSQTRGNTLLGSNYRTPIQMNGFLTGDFSFRSNIDPPSSPELIPVADPNEWSSYDYAWCSNIPAPLSSDPYSQFPLMRRFEAQGNDARFMAGSIEQCKAECVDWRDCNILTASRYVTGNLLALSTYPAEKFYLGALPRKQKYDDFVNIVADACYPGYWTQFEELSSVYPYNLTLYPFIRSQWRRDLGCQEVSGIDLAKEERVDYLASQWGMPTLSQLPLLEIETSNCSGVACDLPGGCPSASRSLAGCAAVIRSKVTGAYLAASPEHRCDDISSQSLAGVFLIGCAYWSSNPMLWTFAPASKHAACGDACASMDPKQVVSLSRGSTCVIQSGYSVVTNLNCGEGDTVAEIEAAYWSPEPNMGTCGALTNRSLPHSGGCAPHAVQQDLLAKVREYCVGSGCQLALGPRGGETVAITRNAPDSISPAANAAPNAFVFNLATSTCGDRPTHLAIQARCSRSVYLSAPVNDLVSRSDDPTVHRFFKAASEPTEASTFFITGTVERTTSKALERECWLSPRRAGDCTYARNADVDAFLFMRYEQTRISFAKLSAERHQSFPDASGKIIAQGNAGDLRNLPSLEGDDVIIYSHGASPRSPVTIVDFAAIGSRSMRSLDGALPVYTRADGTPSAHDVPVGANRRITFPDATGTVITSGNTDDIVFKKIELEGLDMLGNAEFRDAINLGPTSRMTGCFNFAYNEVSADLWTQVCAEDPSQDNEILFPDVSGTVVSTGNTLNLPSLGVRDGESIIVGGDATIEGRIQMGTAGANTTVHVHTWIDGDAGMSIGSGDWDSIDVLRLTAPHMGGVDMALRHWLTDRSSALEINVQGGDSFREVVPGSSRINQTVCEEVMSGVNVYDMHGVGYFLHNRSLARPTRVTGVPYSAASSPRMASRSVCAGPSGSVVCLIGPLCPCDSAGYEPVMRQVEVDEQGILGGGGASQLAEDLARASQGMPPVRLNNTAWEEYLNSTVGVGTNGTNGTNGPGSQYYYTPTKCASLSDPGCGFDGDGSTPFSCDGLDGCILGLRFVSPAPVTLVRFYIGTTGAAEATVGAVIQGCRDADGEVWETFYNFTEVPEAGKYVQTQVDTPRVGPSYLWVRIVWPASEQLVGSIGELEVHTGVVSQRLVHWEQGSRSYAVDDVALRQDPVGSMVMKCASQRWFPARLKRSVHEISIPEASGVLLTTGNLADVSISSGSITSLAVKGGVESGGSTVLGDSGQPTTLEINSVFDGTFPLSFQGSGNAGGTLTFGVPDLSMDSSIQFPDSSGKIVTMGLLPPLTSEMTVVGQTALRGPVSLEGGATIGDARAELRSSLEIHSALATAFPLTFAGSGPANARVTLGVQDPSRPRTLSVPDVSGTVVTTGNLPDVFEKVTFIGEATFLGGASFRGASVALGERGGVAALEMNAPLEGGIPLVFEGNTEDGRTLSVAVEEPSGGNVILLPDVSGTIITTGNFPSVIEDLVVDAPAHFDGDTVMAGPLVTVDGLLSVKAFIAGRYPLVFGEGAAGGGSTSIEVTPPTGNTVLSFPDTSGTIITTGNLPSSVSVEGDYTIIAGSITLSASTLSLGGGDSAQEPDHAGSIVFSDASSPEPMPTERANTFSVRAVGGARFITGRASNGKQLGVKLEAGGSSWSVMSDREVKRDIQPVDAEQVLDSLMRVPVTTWEYAPGGEGVRHMGVMAGDFYRAFGGLGGDDGRISTVDADGVALAALHGLHARHEKLVENAAKLKALVRENAQVLSDNQELIHDNERALEEGEELLSELEAMMR